MILFYKCNVYDNVLASNDNITFYISTLHEALNKCKDNNKNNTSALSILSKKMTEENLYNTKLIIAG